MKFQVPSRVESLGKLEHLIGKGCEQYDYIVVDEAHRFRNEATQSYADLLDICRGKKVILVTATPLNNRIEDIFTQIKLFQVPKSPTIPGVPDLEKFFNRLKKRFLHLERSSREYRQAINEVSKEIRENILKHVMVRRTRSDVTQYFKTDIESQGLVFPEMQDPRKIVYYFAGEVETVFQQTIKLFSEFRYARYIPLLYYTGRIRLSEFEKQQQRNVGGFMKSILVKRLESSFYAFKKSVGRFVDSYERFIRMFESGTVYIGKKVNVYDLMDNDDWEKLEKLVEEEKVQKYDARDFHPGFLADLKHDLEILEQVRDLWRDIDDDPKLCLLIHELKENRDLKKKKLVIFSESKETGDYLYEKLSAAFPGEVMVYSSRGGQCRGLTMPIKHAAARDIIKRNYDPNEKENADDIRILISTDVLAEGINLHRANILVNYDLPWNPTRVLQRAGRINRLGTLHPKIYIFNFFPTSQADMHLGLEVNIINKIQLFHDILGEDARYLSDGEEIGSQELFETLNDKKAYTGEADEGDTELQYLEMMRHIRDEQPDLFEKIKLLPKKARSGFRAEGITASQLVTFFRLGKLKKFYRNENGNPAEITFFEAVKQLQCQPETPRQPVPAGYYRWLEDNKEAFKRDTSHDIETGRVSGGRSNLDYIERRLKDKSFKNFRQFTDSDEEFLENFRKMIAQGTVAKKVAQKIKKELEKTLEPLEMLHILRKHIRGAAAWENQPSRTALKREVILSGYLLPG